jgi:hypothetical protein
VSFKELPLPSIASLRAVAALKSTHLAMVRPARIGLGFETVASNQKTLAEVERALGGPGRLSLPYSLRWLLDAMAGLGLLYRTLGFVHGELQPEHIVLGEDGIGRLVPVVRAHWVRGEQRPPESLYYLAPEKLLGDGVDARSDVFSAGVMLWEAVAGQRLLEAYSVEDVIARLMSGGIPRARAPEGEGWTAPLAVIAERAIAVDPARRFSAIGEMRDAITQVSARYLASTPGMVALFQHPEQRVRGRPRDSFAPESQRATLPPGLTQPLEPAAQRLSRPHLSSVDLEEELTRPKGGLSGREAAAIARPKPSAPVSNTGKVADTLLGVQPGSLGAREAALSDELTRPFMRIPASEPAPAPSPAPVPVAKAKPAAPAGSVPPLASQPAPSATSSPVPPHRPTPPYFRSPVSSLPPEPVTQVAARSQPAPTAAPATAVAIPRRQTMSSWPPPISPAAPANVPPASAPPPTAPAPATSRPPAAANAPQQTMSSWPPRPVAATANEPQRTLAWPPIVAESRMPSSAPPLAAAPRKYTHEAFDPSYELMRPRRSGTVILVVLGAAVAGIGFFVVRPWLAQRAAAESAAIAPSDAAQAVAPHVPPQPSAAISPDPPSPPSAAPTVSASAPPSVAPAARVASGRGRAARDEHVAVHDSPEPVPQEISAPPPEPPPAPEPTSAPEPAATPEPPPPPPAPKPKPLSDADRYGI